jgi:hypothetical protein
VASGDSVTLPRERHHRSSIEEQRLAVTTVVQNVKIDTPCTRCGSRQIWILKYISGSFRKFVALCADCRHSIVLPDDAAVLSGVVANGRVDATSCTLPL